LERQQTHPPGGCSRQNREVRENNKQAVLKAKEVGEASKLILLEAVLDTIER
jgi:hypothetical protein